MSVTVTDSANADEQQILLRVQAGESDAFRILVERYAEALTRAAFYLTRSRDTADDIVQSVFIQVWNNRTGLDPERPIRPYLLRAVRNRAMNEIKSESVRDRYIHRAQAEADVGTLPVVNPSHEVDILNRATIEAALHQISPRRRTALSLWLMEELSDEDVATALGTSVTAADRLIRRALADLRVILENT